MALNPDEAIQCWVMDGAELTSEMQFWDDARCEWFDVAARVEADSRWIVRLKPKPRSAEDVIGEWLDNEDEIKADRVRYIAEGLRKEGLLNEADHG